MSFRKRISSLVRLRQRIRSQKTSSSLTRRLLIETMEERRLLTTIDLAALAATEGMIAYGATADDHSGLSVSDAGDFNGDGFDDILIGARLFNAGGSDRGAAYLIYGGPAMPASLDLNSLGSFGIAFTGVTNFDWVGRSVSAAGDLNGDGLDDLIVGADGGDGSANTITNAGESYVIFGSTSLSGTISVSSAASVIIFGINVADSSGRSVSGAGDVNGDGYDDLIIGATEGDGTSIAVRNNSGESYIVFGGASMPAIIELAALGSAGVTIYGSGANDGSGRSVSSAGDVNGDGYDDVIIGTGSAGSGAPLSPARSSNGESYVVFGGPSLPVTIDLAVPAATFITLIGAQDGDLAGYTVGGGGDVNGDGFDDVVINAPGGDGPGVFTRSNAGDSYIVFGSAALPATIDLLTLGSAGVTIFGAQLADAGVDVNSGGSMSVAGDINGDGYDDVIIGKERADAAVNTSFAGDSIVIFGGPSLPSTIDLAVSGSAGITIFGVDPGDYSGVSVSSAGNVNGDGFADLLTGAFLANSKNNARSNAGESYLIYGGNGFTSSVTHPGTSSPETLTGTAEANVMVGGRGNDILFGNGGADVLNGGEGDDTLAVSTLPFQRVTGGNGDDTLRLDGSGLTLDLTTLADNRLQGIERIDITGSGINTLTLNYREVLNISDESNQLIVRRNGGDIVNIGSGWTQGADQMIGSDNFQTYTQGIATLLVEDTTPIGTTGDDAFVLTYLSTSTSGDLSITRSTNGGPIEDLGVFPMAVPLILDGLLGTDSVRIVGTSSNDTFAVNGLGLTINGAGLTLAGIENRTLVGAAGNDLYQFDTGLPLGLYALDEALGGIDTIDFSSSSLATTLNLGLATSQVINANLSLNLGSTTRFENAIGGSGNDTLTGNTINNTLSGGSGNDTLNGARGNDVMLGGQGDDTYVFAAAATAEADSVVELPSEGIDRLSFTSISTPVTLNLGTTALQSVHTNRTLVLNDAATFENASGGSNNDVLTGNALNNELVGGAGNDTLNGGAGNDTLLGGQGNDNYVFDIAATAEADLVTESTNQGTDTLNFANITTAVTLNMASSAVQNVHANRTIKLNAGTTFENAIGGSGNDVLTGNTLNNALSGGNGNDTLNGGQGNDVLDGGQGNDSYLFSAATTAEADSVVELAGQGIDRLNFSGIATPVTLGLGVTTAQVVHTNRTLTINDAATFEQATGGSSNDVLTGNALNNELVGGSGNDTLNGLAGNDTLLGGFGDDIYVFDPAVAPEAILVTELTNQGIDTLNFSSLTTAVSLNLATTAVQAAHANRTVKLNAGSTFENAIGGSGDDLLLGNALNNSLAGGSGNDILVGNAGADQLLGEAGRDILIGGLDLDTLNGGADDDILIAGRTTNDSSVTRLTDMRTEWISANSYAARITNLRAGVGASNASLQALVNVLNDAGDDDILTGGSDNDWYFVAVDDLITDLFGGEITDAL